MKNQNILWLFLSHFFLLSLFISCASEEDNIEILGDDPSGYWIHHAGTGYIYIGGSISKFCVGATDAEFEGTYDSKTHIINIDFDDRSGAVFEVVATGDEMELIQKFSDGHVTSTSYVRSSIYPCGDEKYVELEEGLLVDDRDGKEYRTLKIGNLTFMQDYLNFNYVGSNKLITPIYNGVPSSQKYYLDRSWKSVDINTGIERNDVRHYTWEAAGNALPDGWRLPEKEEIQTLRDMLEWKTNKDATVEEYFFNGDIATNNNGEATLFGVYEISSFSVDKIQLVGGTSNGKLIWCNTYGGINTNGNFPEYAAFTHRPEYSTFDLNVHNSSYKGYLVIGVK